MNLENRICLYAAHADDIITMPICTSRKGEPMTDIGDICMICMESEHDCRMCSLGNPCLGCEDYDQVNDTCKSNGGCYNTERKTNK